MALHPRVAVCSLTFDPAPRKRARTLPAVSPDPIPPVVKEVRAGVPGGSFIPRGSIRSKIQMEKARRFKNTPLLPAAVTYSRTSFFTQNFPNASRGLVYSDSLPYRWPPATESSSSSPKWSCRRGGSVQILRRR
jgi:hypothetical protein